MKRNTIIVLATLCLCAGLLIALIGLPDATLGASYDGRSAGSWLADISMTNESAASDAFQAMGTNAFPALIHALRKKESPLDRLYQGLYLRLPAWLQKHLTRPLRRDDRVTAIEMVVCRNHACREFLPELIRAANEEQGDSLDIIEGTMAGVVEQGDTNAVPLFIQALQRTNVSARVAAVLGLGQIGPDAKAAVPALNLALTDTNGIVRLCVARALWEVSGETNTVKPVIRAVMNDLSEPAGIRRVATNYLHDIESPDTSLIPIYIGWLGDSGYTLRISAANSLARFGSAAREAVPTLVKMAGSGNQDERQSALSALRRIDPEAAAKYEDK